MIESGQSLSDTMSKLGIAKVDAGAEVELCRELLLANPKIVQDLKGGKMQAVGAIVGQAKKRNPNVNPNRVREICLELVQSM